MTMRSSDSLRNARGAARTTLADAGAGAAVLKIYAGAKPTTKGGPPTGDLLVTFEMGSPIAGAPSGGVWTANSVSDVTASTSGVPTFAVLEDSAGNFVEDYDARLSTATDAGEEVVITISGGGTSIVSGGTVGLDSYAITSGNV